MSAARRVCADTVHSLHTALCSSSRQQLEYPVCLTAAHIRVYSGHMRLLSFSTTCTLTLLPAACMLLLLCHSWGTGNGDKGFFKVRYGVCGMLASGDTIGVSFIPAQPVTLNVTGPVPDPLSPTKSRTCYNYTVGGSGACGGSQSPSDAKLRGRSKSPILTDAVCDRTTDGRGKQLMRLCPTPLAIGACLSS